MKEKDILRAVEVITKEQIKGCAPVKMSIGYANKDNIVMKGIVIYDCPPIIIDVLTKEGFTLSMHNGGLYVSYIG